MTGTLGPRSLSSLENDVQAGGHVIKTSLSSPASGEKEGEVRAFAKIQGRNWTYYVQKISVVIGRNDQPASPSSEVDIHLGNGDQSVSKKHLRIDYAGANGWEMYCFGKTGVTVDGVHYEAFCQPIQLGAKSFITVGEVEFYFLLPIGIYSRVAGKGESAAEEEHHRHHQHQGHHHQGHAQRNKEPYHGGDDDSSEPTAAKPFVSYACLIAEAINSVPDQRLTLADIYKYLMDKYPYFRQTKNGWQNSIRHNLSLNKAFLKVPRTGGEPGKGMFWVIDPNHRHLVEGKAYGRRGPASASGISASGVSTGKQPRSMNHHHQTFTPYQIPGSKAAHMNGVRAANGAFPNLAMMHQRPQQHPSLVSIAHVPPPHSHPNGVMQLSSLNNPEQQQSHQPAMRATSTISIPRSMMNGSPASSSAHNMLLEAAQALEDGSSMDEGETNTGGSSGDDMPSGVQSAPSYGHQAFHYAAESRQQPHHPQPSRPIHFNNLHHHQH